MAQNLPTSIDPQPYVEEEETVPGRSNASPDASGNDVINSPPEQITSNATRRLI